MYIEDTNLSRAWVRAFLEVCKPGRDRLVPLVVTVTGLSDNQVGEDAQVRQALNETLRVNGCFDCQTVASTLFPQALWNPALPREELFKRYLKIFPQVKRAQAGNKYGLYFERLIAYGPKRINQLDHIISTYQLGNRRPSALQASIFMPSSDHTNQRQRGFPCMQHVAFARINDSELSVTGFYASQYMFERAYGNYLGLCRLGHFMAHEMGLRFTQMTCCAATALRSRVSKNRLTPLIETLEGIGRMVENGVPAVARQVEVNYG